MTLLVTDLFIFTNKLLLDINHLCIPYLGFGTNGKSAMSPVQSQGSIFKYLMSAGLRANHNVPFNRCYCKQLSSSASRGTNAGR